MIGLLLLFAFAPVRAETVELELLRPDGKSFALHRALAPGDGEQIVVPDGKRAWSIVLHRHEYEGRLEICADLSEWQADGVGQSLARPCVAISGLDTPSASVTAKADRVQLRLQVSR
jgi:hypothetical protein